VGKSPPATRNILYKIRRKSSYRVLIDRKQQEPSQELEGQGGRQKGKRKNKNYTMK
jgi:hypothetical protein